MTETKLATRGPLRRNIRKSPAEWICKILIYALLVVMNIIFLFPFWNIIVKSVVGAEEFARRGSFLMYAEKIDWSAYKMLLSGDSIIYRGYFNTIFIVVMGTFLSMVVTAMLAYALSKKTMPGRNIFNFLIFFTMLFSGGLVPQFLLNKSLGLFDNIWVMILPNLVSAWNMFILRNFFSQIPPSLEESALIDGATPMSVLFRIVIPLSLPSIATIGLFYAVGYWNAWFNASIYINDNLKLPVQNIMRNIIIDNDIAALGAESAAHVTTKPTSEGLKSAVIIVSTIPIMLVYPYIQKYFVKGIMVGGVKG